MTVTVTIVVAATMAMTIAVTATVTTAVTIAMTILITIIKLSIYDLFSLPKGPRGLLFREYLPVMGPLLNTLRDIAKTRKKTVSQVRYLAITTTIVTTIATTIVATVTMTIISIIPPVGR